MKVTASRQCPLSRDDVFAVAADIESYPGFLPNCRAMRIVERRGNEWLVDNSFRMGLVPLSFRTRAVLDPPASINIHSTGGLGPDFSLLWQFDETDDGCGVTFAMTLDMSPGGIAEMAKSTLQNHADRAIDAFIRRALERRPAP